MKKRILSISLSLLMVLAAMPSTTFAMEEAAPPQETAIVEEVRTPEGEPAPEEVSAPEAEAAPEEVPAPEAEAGSEDGQAPQGEAAPEEVPAPQGEAAPEEVPAPEAEATDPEKTGTTDAQTAAPENKAETFRESRTVDGVVVSVAAEAGVFPKGATLSVRKLTGGEAALAEKAVSEERAADNAADLALAPDDSRGPLGLPAERGSARLEGDPEAAAALYHGGKNGGVIHSGYDIGSRALDRRACL